LVVDDDGEMAEMVSDYIVQRGYRAETAVGGKAAIAALKKKGFDAVITDLRMDAVDGFDVLAASLASDATRPVIIMTAYGSIDGALEAVRRGASHYLTKPFKLEEVALYLDKSCGARTNSSARRSTSGSGSATSSARARSCCSSTICSSGSAPHRRRCW
jgi:two-component system response regulator HydG